MVSHCGLWDEGLDECLLFELSSARDLDEPAAQSSRSSPLQTGRAGQRSLSSTMGTGSNLEQNEPIAAPPEEQANGLDLLKKPAKIFA